jgi:hypothetical protein
MSATEFLKYATEADCERIAEALQNVAATLRASATWCNDEQGAREAMSPIIQRAEALGGRAQRRADNLRNGGAR